MSAWEKREILYGSWLSPLSGQPGQGVFGSTSFTYDLNKKIVLRHSRAEFMPEQGGLRDQVHEDWLIIFERTGEPRLHAVYFDNKGHTINYM